jgi:hypothetical protein
MNHDSHCWNPCTMSPGDRLDRAAHRQWPAARRLLAHGYNEPMSGSDRLKPAGLKLTYDDFVLFPDDGKRHELIDGEHFATPSPNIRHQQISINLTLMIGSWLETHPLGRLFYAPLDVVFSNFAVVEPDLRRRTSGRRLDDSERGGTVCARYLLANTRIDHASHRKGGVFTRDSALAPLW